MAMNGRSSDVHAVRSRRRALDNMPDVTRFLLPKEELRYKHRRHPIVLLPSLALVVLLVVLAGFMVTAVGAGAVLNLYLLIIVGSALWFLYRVLRWTRIVLVVTDRRVFEVESLIISRATIKPVFRQAVVFVQDPIGERLNYGTILTEMPNGDRVNTFKWIHDPRRFYAAVTDRAI